MRTTCALLLVLAACASSASSADPTIARKPHLRIAQASILPGQSLPEERDGIRLEDTGSILWVCAGSEKHEDKEVTITKCPSCREQNYFYFDHTREGFRCYACLSEIDDALLRCPECGRPPRRVRQKPSLVH